MDPIKLNHELFFIADKIYNPVAQLLLTAKLVVQEFAVSQSLPLYLFSGCKVVPHESGIFQALLCKCFVVNGFHKPFYPSPRPSPTRGEGAIISQVYS